MCFAFKRCSLHFWYVVSTTRMLIWKHLCLLEWKMTNKNSVKDLILCCFVSFWVWKGQLFVKLLLIRRLLPKERRWTVSLFCLSTFIFLTWVFLTQDLHKLIMCSFARVLQMIGPLTLEQALSARDALAKAIYGRTFTWLVQKVNRSLAFQVRKSILWSNPLLFIWCLKIIVLLS